ncbi:MAG TPA: hypothetical protein VIY27_05605 [Myxococcota bacterium]
MSEDLCYLSACEAIERFQARTLSPVELLRALIERAEQVDARINAFTYDRFEVALREAEETEAAYARGTPPAAGWRGSPWPSRTRRACGASPPRRARCC